MAAEQQSKLVVGYWDIRCLAEPIRFLLEYTGLPYEDRRYVQGHAPDYSREHWFGVKNSLGLDFPNLPYLIDGDVKITQSNAILRHIARKANPALLGKDLKEQAQIDMLIDVLVDFRNESVDMFYCDPNEFAEKKARFLNRLPGSLKQFDAFLGDKKFLAGDEPTVPDFHFCEMLSEHVMMEPHCLQGFSHLQAYLARFRALPAIEAYMKTDRFRNTPVNNKVAAWGANATEASH
ncbi:Glutathione Stransferase [Acanthamoeba castellanii str. Neff]|uniref:glutathione transferase n=1 Tax=Acanthamoeba castellanii (strain ATCC 30010 / Neff) TaxID=1257118 RepID=L8H557_ACACF|nr:Glutathione Stransferase [Acanthamoeba castellanii str. Neff]ELR19868.1 Glutathione Stransferase [Acanthamoeba castellanii str. Neff]